MLITILVIMAHLPTSRPQDIAEIRAQRIARYRHSMNCAGAMVGAETAARQWAVTRGFWRGQAAPVWRGAAQRWMHQARQQAVIARVPEREVHRSWNGRLNLIGQRYSSHPERLDADLNACRERP